jgi:hypothetical protein
MAKLLQNTKWNNATNAHSLANLTNLAIKRVTVMRRSFGFAQVADENETYNK